MPMRERAMMPQQLNDATCRAQGWNAAIEAAARIVDGYRVNAEIAQKIRALDKSLKAIDDMEV